jgi:hypothetical protein
LVVERLGAGAVHLTAIKLLAPLLTEENHVELLDRARGRTKKQIEAIVAELAPKPDVPARLRKLPEARRRNGADTSASTGLFPASSLQADSSPVASDEPSVSTPLSAAVAGATSEQPEVVASGPAASSTSATFALQAPRARGKLKQLSPGRYKLELTLDQEGHDQIVQLVELMRHQNPSGDITRIVERALKELLERTMKRRFAQIDVSEQKVTREVATPKPPAEPTRDVRAPKSRYIPRQVLREVYARDKGQCTYVSPDGRRCSARGFLEVHHHNTTFARGGEATADNLRLTCRAHNLFLAGRDYGRTFMEQKLSEAVGRKQRAGSSRTA